MISNRGSPISSNIRLSRSAQRIAAAHVVERIDEVDVGRRQRLDGIEGLDAQAGKPVDVGLDAGGNQLRTMVRVSAK